LVAWFVTFFWLKETVQNPVPVRQYIFGKESKPSTENSDNAATSGSDSRDSSDVSSECTRADCREEALSLSSILTPRVLLASTNYALICLVDISFRALQPLFFATPLEMGGLGFPPAKIGTILSLYGALNCLFQLLFFAKIHDRIGTKGIMILGLSAAIPGFALFPVMNRLGLQGASSPALWSLIMLQIGFLMLLNMTYGAIFMYVTASSPNKASLGAVNGFGQMLVSLTRTVGPAFTNSLFSLTMEWNYLGGFLVYVASAFVVLFSIMVARRLPKRVWEM
jgi:MFS family permease